MAHARECLIEPEIVLPLQFSGTSRRQAPSLTGEVQLGRHGRLRSGPVDAP